MASSVNMSYTSVFTRGLLGGSNYGAQVHPQPHANPVPSVIQAGPSTQGIEEQPEGKVRGSVKRARQAVQKRKERDRTRALLNKLDTLLPEIPKAMMGARFDNSLGPSGRSLKQIIQDASTEIQKRKAGDFSTATKPADDANKPLTSTNTGLQARSDFGMVSVTLPLWEVRHASDGFSALFDSLPFDVMLGWKLILAADVDSRKEMMRWRPTAPGERISVRLMLGSRTPGVARLRRVELRVSLLRVYRGVTHVVLVCDPRDCALAAEGSGGAAEAESLAAMEKASGVYSFDFERSSHNPLLVAVGLKQHWAEFDSVIPSDTAKHDERVPSFILQPCFWLGKQVGRLVLFRLSVHGATSGEFRLQCEVKAQLPSILGGIGSRWRQFAELSLNATVPDNLMDSPADWAFFLVTDEDSAASGTARVCAFLSRRDEATGKRQLLHSIEGWLCKDHIRTVCCVPWDPENDITYFLKKDDSHAGRRNSDTGCAASARGEERVRDSNKHGFLRNPFLQ